LAQKVKKIKSWPAAEETPFPGPPEHLSARAKSLWAVLGPEHARTAGRQLLLQAGLEALDRSDEARNLITRDGLVAITETTGAVHVHPCARVEREARAQLCRIFSLLGIAAGVEFMDS
jgi:phage terminase small subunit